MRKLIVSLSILWIIAILMGCAVKFIGDYDVAIDTGISGVQQQTEVYLNKLKTDPTTPYNQDVYTDINARLKVLKTRAHITPQYSIIEQQIEELQEQFDRLQMLDKGMVRPFPLGVIDAAETAITTSVESILRLELALKRGDKNPPTLKK